MHADITWLHGGRTLCAKYKTHVVTEDLYQVLAYCTVLQLHHGHLVYVGGEGAETHRIQNAGVEGTAHVLNLDQPPKRLLDELDALADPIVN